MSELGSIKPTIQTVPIRVVKKDPDKKEQRKKKKGKGLPEQRQESSEKHVNEYI
ncbi:MAG: hypothetical protein ABGY08_11035 [Gammaproteobacteria bacterium]|jgi:hypothetical protein